MAILAYFLTLEANFFSIALWKILHPHVIQRCDRIPPSRKDEELEQSIEESIPSNRQHKSHSEMWNFPVRFSRTAEVPIEESTLHKHIL